MLFGVERIRQLGANFLLQGVIVLLIELRRRDFTFFLPDSVVAVFLNKTDLLDFGVAEFDRVDDHFFAHFLRARLNHHDAIGGADDHNVHRTLAHLIVGRIDDELPVKLSHADRTDRPEEWNIGKRERGRCAVNSKNVRIVAGIGRKHEGDDLSLALESLGEHRPHRTIDLPTGEHFALAHAAFALDEAARKTSTGVGVFTVINREWEKIDALPRIGVGDGGGEDDVIALAYNGGSMSLLG